MSGDTEDEGDEAIRDEADELSPAPSPAAPRRNPGRGGAAPSAAHSGGPEAVPGTVFAPAEVLPGGALAPDLSRIGVTLSRREGPVPLAVSFQLRSDDPNFAQFLMFGSAEWRFSEAPAEDYRFRDLDGDLAGERAGRAGGAYVGHVYVSPGRHGWSVTLRYPGLPARTIAAAGRAILGGGVAGAVEALDPERYFAGRTVYFSNAYQSPEAFRADARALGIPGDLGLDRYQVGEASFRRALAAATGRDGPPWRFLLQAGRTYRLTRDTINNSVVNCFVDRFGPGADPVITLRRDAAGGSDVTGGFFFGVDDRRGLGPCGLANLYIRGLYDSTRPGTIEPWIGVQGIRLNNPRNFGVQVFRCRFAGLFTAINCVARATATVIADCKVTSWFNYAVWHGAQDDSAIAGCALKQAPGTVNTGRKSTGVADTGDRATFADPAPALARFDWSLEWNERRDPPWRGPRLRRHAPAIPAGEAAPRRGGWTTVSPWWKANWDRFQWAPPNREAFTVHDNGRWLNAAVHGPYRAANPGFRVGLHQCELRSLNGWSRSRHFRADAPPEAQPPEAFAIQPCLRIATAVRPEFVGHSTSVHRLALEGGTPTVAVLPQRSSLPVEDDATLPLAVVVSDCIVRAGAQTGTAVAFAYGRCVLRNSLIHVPAAPGPTARGVTPVGGSGRELAGAGAPVHVFNTTVVVERVLPEGTLNLPRPQPGRRAIVARNMLVLDHGRFANSADLVPPSAFADLRPGPFAGIAAPYVPGPLSNVLGASDAIAPSHDLRGTPRPSPAALGAFEAEA